MLISILGKFTFLFFGKQNQNVCHLILRWRCEKRNTLKTQTSVHSLT